MNHIDRSALSNDLPSRIDYLTKFVNFGQEDIEALNNAAPLAKPLVPSIVDAVYHKLFSFDITKQSFLPRNSGFDGNVATSLDSLSEDHDQIKFRKDFLKVWAVKFFTSKYDAQAWEYFNKVGVMHTGVAGFKHREKKEPLHVDYMHCAILLAYVGDILTEAFLSLPEETLSLTQKTRLVRATQKMLWIQNDLFARHYIKDSVPVSNQAGNQDTNNLYSSL